MDECGVRITSYFSKRDLVSFVVTSEN